MMAVVTWACIYLGHDVGVSENGDWSSDGEPEDNYGI